FDEADRPIGVERTERAARPERIVDDERRKASELGRCRQARGAGADDEHVALRAAPGVCRRDLARQLAEPRDASREALNDAAHAANPGEQPMVVDAARK